MTTATVPSKGLLIVGVMALAALLGCSGEGAGNDGSTADGFSNGSSGSSGGAACKEQFCLEDNQNIHVDPSSLVFADLASGSEQKLELTIINTGDRGVLTVQSPTIEPISTELEIVNAKGENIEPGGHAKWTVLYKPKLSGAKQHFIVVNNNSVDDSKRALKISVRVKSGAGVLVATPDPLEFGAVASQTTANKSIKVFNQGDKTLKIESILIDPNGGKDFKLDKSPEAPFDLAPKQSFEAVIAFTPANGGIDATHLLVGHSNGQTLPVSITGEEIGPLIAIAPPTLNYGQLADGAKQTRSLKIFSKGKADLHISKIEVDPTSTFKNLLINESGPFVLKPQTSQIIDVELAADKTLPKTSAEVAWVLIHSDDPNVNTIKVPIKVQAEPCVAGSSSFSVKAGAAKGQVDIVLVIDSSGSMKDEKKAVADNLNKFATDIVSKNIDHHVVLIGQGMCVPPPLAGPGCANSPSFKHVNVKVGSTDGLSKVIETYSQWQGFLRVGAQRHFVFVTDDNSKKDGNWFTSELAKLKNPGFPNFYVFHSIVGWSAQGIPGLPCFGASGYPSVYIDLSKKTGGVLASICSQSFVPPDWSNVFAKIGQNVVSTIKVVCTYALPAKSKDGKPVDPATISLSFKKPDGSMSTIPRIDGVSKCGASSHGWYYDNAQAPTAAILCPTSCTKLKGTALSFNFGC